MTEIEGIFNELYDSTYQKTLIYVTAKCSKLHDVEDILQEIYTEVYSVLLNKGREYIQNEEAFVIKIAKTKIFRHYSLKQRLSAITLNIAKEEEKELFDYIPDSFVLEDELCTKETLEEIGKFVLSKPPDTQKIFTLFYLHDLTISDIADLLCTSESFVKNRLYRTLREIKKEYGGEKE